MGARATILVSGMMAADPWQGGATWAVLQYVLGLAELGHEVYFIEPVAPKALRPESGVLESSENARYFRETIHEFGLEGRAGLLLNETSQTVGLAYEELEKIAHRADLLINIAGLLTDPRLFLAVPKRVYLDLDPAFSQLWHAVQGIDMRFAGHTHFFTIGQAIGRPDCPIPSCGLDWLPTLQPVVLHHWPRAHKLEHRALTTIGNWRAYGSIEHGGVFYGQKAHSLRPLFVLPTLTNEKFRLALGIDPGETPDLKNLSAYGWELLDPFQMAGTPQAYRRFIQGSKAEFGIAKSGYVAARCGWFSDRSVCYLASGRPVLAQETGFSHYLPVGEGLFAFRDVESVLASLETLNADYGRHAAAARALAEEYFASDKVLAHLLERVGL